MARDTVLVVGAGASYGARMSEPYERRPPLGKDLAGYLRGWYDENAPRPDPSDPWTMAMADETDGTAPSDELYDCSPEVRAVLAEAVALCAREPRGFERVMQRLLVAGETSPLVLTKLNAVIAVSFLGGKRCFPGRADDTYTELLRRLKDRLRCVVTPNYDLLSEEALEGVGLTFRYACVTGDAGAQVVMYKFHGSANFFQAPGASGGTTLEAARQG